MNGVKLDREILGIKLARDVNYQNGYSQSIESIEKKLRLLYVPIATLQ